MALHAGSSPAYRAQARGAEKTMRASVPAHGAGTSGCSDSDRMARADEAVAAGRDRHDSAGNGAGENCSNQERQAHGTLDIVQSTRPEGHAGRLDDNSSGPSVLSRGQIVGIATCPNVVFVMVWPARVLEIPVRDVRAFEGRVGARVRLEIEEEDAP